MVMVNVGVWRVVMVRVVMMRMVSSCTLMSYIFLEALGSCFCLQFDGFKDVPVGHSVSRLRVEFLFFHGVFHFVVSRFVLVIVVSHCCLLSLGTEILGTMMIDGIGFK